MPRVAITRADRIEDAIEQALGHLDLDLIVRGKLVAVKANETWASPADTTGVTQPDTLRAALRILKRHGPRALVVTGGAGAAETADVFRLAGLTEVIADEGVELFDHNRPPFEPVTLEYEPRSDVKGPQRQVMVNPRVLTFESLVVLSNLKVHETATVTLALKNLAMSYPAADWYGHPRSTQRQRHHFFDDMHSFIAAMARRFPIALAVTVGHPAMIGTGPLGGHTFETGLCVASDDALAADVAGARLLGFEVDAVHHLWEAGKLGVGVADTERMEFPALSLEEAFGIFTEKAYGHRLSLSHA